MQIVKQSRLRTIQVFFLGTGKFFLGGDKEQQSTKRNLHYHPTTSGEVSLPLYIEIPVSTARQPRERSNEKNLMSVGWLIFWFPPLCCKEKK